jgi:cell division protein FtsQ
MPKAAPPKRFTWKTGLSIAAGLLLFAVLFQSTAMATRYVRALLLADERFFLESSVFSTGATPGGGTPGIRVEGNHYTSRDRILLVFAPDLNKSIFRIPLAERRRRLLGIDWVEDASVMRIWPNQLIVKVRERRPVAFAKLPMGVSGQFRYLLIDGQGVLLGVPRQRFDFPVLTGITEDQPEPDRLARVIAMQHLLRQLGASAAGMIYEINAASLQDMRVSAKINGHTVELWLGEQNYLARFQNFTNHFEEISRQSDGASVFDLRLDDRIMTVR